MENYVIEKPAILPHLALNRQDLSLSCTNPSDT